MPTKLLQPARLRRISSGISAIRADSRGTYSNEKAVLDEQTDAALSAWEGEGGGLAAAGVKYRIALSEVR